MNVLPGYGNEEQLEHGKGLVLKLDAILDANIHLLIWWIFTSVELHCLLLCLEKIVLDVSLMR